MSLRHFSWPRRVLAGLALMIAAMPVGWGAAGDAGDWTAIGSLRMGVTQVIPDQVETAAEIGVNFFQLSGIYGYEGLPDPETLKKKIAHWRAVNDEAHRRGICRMIGYECATSIVGDAAGRTKWFEFFDKHWLHYLGHAPQEPPEQWMQQGIDGKPLPSWYNYGPYVNYHPACHNHPDWQAYQKLLIRLQFEAGFDGIFYDDPNKHPQGCYCRYCMEDFRGVLREQGVDTSGASLEQLRQWTRKYPQAFEQSRLLASANFLKVMKQYATGLRPGSVIYYNNSLNDPSKLYAHARQWGFSIWNWSKYQDLIMVEDALSHPRKARPNKEILFPAYRQRIGEYELCEYASSYKQLHAISRGRPVSATSVTGESYLQPPELIQLGMAEATANQSIYVIWPLWLSHQSEINPRIRRYCDFLARHRELWAGSESLNDAQLFLPLRRWLQTDVCAAYDLATRLCAANIQFEMVTEDQLTTDSLRRAPVLIAATQDALTTAERELTRAYEAQGGRLLKFEAGTAPEAIKERLRQGGPVLARLDNAPFVRVYLRRQPGRILAHLVNYDVERIEQPNEPPPGGQYEAVLKGFPKLLAPSRGVVKPATDVVLRLMLPKGIHPTSAEALTPDCEQEKLPLHFSSRTDMQGTEVSIIMPQVNIHTVVKIDCQGL